VVSDGYISKCSLISDIRALWRLSARMPEIENIGRPGWPRVTSWYICLLKG